MRPAAPPSAAAPSVAGAALAAGTLGFALVLAHLLPALSPGGGGRLAAPRSAPEALALVLPGLYREAPPGGAARVRVASPPAPASNLARSALLPERSMGASRLPYVGLASLVLALVAACSARGRPALLLRGLLVAALLLGALLPQPSRLAGLLLATALAGLAAIGLLDLTTRPHGGAAGAPLALAGLSVLLAAALAGLALQAGAVSDRALLQPLLDRAPASAEGPASALAANAAGLRAVLDRSALAAFASMAALLVHGRRRRGWTAWLVGLVAIADVISAGWL